MVEWDSLFSLWNIKCRGSMVYEHQSDRLDIHSLCWIPSYLTFNSIFPFEQNFINEVILEYSKLWYKHPSYVFRILNTILVIIQWKWAASLSSELRSKYTLYSDLGQLSYNKPIYFAFCIPWYAYEDYLWYLVNSLQGLYFLRLLEMSYIFLDFFYLFKC